jgi:hypothetical protein
VDPSDELTFMLKILDAPTTEYEMSLYYAAVKGTKRALYVQVSLLCRGSS